MNFLHTDIPDLRDYDTGVVLSNLACLQQRKIRLDEMALAELWELAMAIRADAEEDPDTIDSILLSLQDPSREEETEEMPAVINHVPAIHRALLLAVNRRTGLYQRLVLYRFLSIQEAQEKSSYPRRPSGVTPAARGRIAYMKSSFADKAFLSFSERIPNCRAAEAHSFVDACEEVFNGLCEYCILPLESTDQGRLTAFSRLILKYNLFIVATCDMEDAVLSGMGHRRATRFGLLCRHRIEDAHWYQAPRFSFCTKANGDGRARGEGTTPLRLEIIHHAPPSSRDNVTDGPSFTELLSVAEFCRLPLLRTDSLPVAELFHFLTTDESSAPDETPPPEDQPSTPAAPPICIVLDATNYDTNTPDIPDIPTFLRWLSLEAPDDRVIGHYGML